MAEKKQPWMKWYPSDWRSETGLRMVSRAARSLWLDMIGLMHEAEPYGELRLNGRALKPSALAKLLGDREAEILKLMAELEVAGVFSRRDDGTIFSRRMIRDKEKSETAQERGEMGGHPNIRRGSVPKDQRTRRFRRSDAPVKTARILEMDGGCCHWCRVVLTTETDHDGTIPPNIFHVDHVIPIKDGGGNEEENLVASCGKCNHERKYDLNIEDMVGRTSDHMPQKLEARDQKPDSIARDGSGALWKEVWAAFQTWGRLPDTSTEARARGAWERMAADLPEHAVLLAAIHAQGERLREGGGKRGGWATAPHNWLERDRGWAANVGAVGNLKPVDEAAERAAWDGQAGKLIDALGDRGAAVFASWFHGAHFVPGPPVRICVANGARKSMIEQKFDKPLRRAFGEVILEVAA